MAELELCFSTFIHWILQYLLSTAGSCLERDRLPSSQRAGSPVQCSGRSSSVQAHNWVVQSRSGLYSLIPGLVVIQDSDGMPDNLVALCPVSCSHYWAVQKLSIAFLRWFSSCRCFSLWPEVPLFCSRSSIGISVEAKVDFLILFLSILTAPLLCVQDPPSFAQSCEVFTFI